MKELKNGAAKASETLKRLQREYHDLLGFTSFSLEKALAPEDFSFYEFCNEFDAHAQSDQLKLIAEAYGKEHGIWLPNAKHHITCALFLYPNADFERLLTMMKNLTLGFYMNDVMGRDTFRSLAPEQQKESRKMAINMSALNDTLYVPPGAHPLEFVNAEILKEFRDSSPEGWFSHFLEIYSYHVGITHTDGNTDTAGRVPDILEYMERRCHLGGVHHILLWIEYSDGKFLDWELLAAMNIAEDLKRLHWVTAAFAGLSNDLFSFEKEVIDNGSDSNLVAIVALNNPKITLKDAILRASEIVKDLLKELLSLMNSIQAQKEKLEKAYPEYTSTLNTHIKGVVKCVQAIWLWHCHSKRYKRSVSLWNETTLVSESA